MTISVYFKQAGELHQIDVSSFDPKGSIDAVARELRRAREKPDGTILARVPNVGPKRDHNDYLTGAMTFRQAQ